MIIGLLLAFLLILIIDGSDGLSDVMNKDVNASKIAISIACTFVSLIITAILQFSLHEVDPLLFGLASGYKFSLIKAVALYALALHQSLLHLSTAPVPCLNTQMLNELESHREDYLMPGEYLTAIYLVGQCDTVITQYT